MLNGMLAGTLPDTMPDTLVDTLAGTLSDTLADTLSGMLAGAVTGVLAGDGIAAGAGTFTGSERHPKPGQRNESARGALDDSGTSAALHRRAGRPAHAKDSAPVRHREHAEHPPDLNLPLALAPGLLDNGLG